MNQEHNEIPPYAVDIPWQNRIHIRESKSADTRSADTFVTRDMLYSSSEQHISDVVSALEFVILMLHKIAIKHDHTKLDDIEQFHMDFEYTQRTQCNFTELPWYQCHITEERHHLDKRVPENVNLLDVLEHIADIVMAGMGRTGEVLADSLPEGVLWKAYQNTIELMAANTVVTEAEPDESEPVTLTVTLNDIECEGEFCQREVNGHARKCDHAYYREWQDRYDKHIEMTTCGVFNQILNEREGKLLRCEECVAAGQKEV